MQWFESLAAHWDMDEAQFTLSGVTRKTDETFGSVRSRAPGLATAALRAYRGPEGARAATPFDVPFRLAGLQLTGRRVRVMRGAQRSGSDADPADLVLTAPLPARDDPGPVLDALASAKAAARALVVSAGAAGAAGDRLAAVLAQAAACPVDLLIVDLSGSSAFEPTGHERAADAARVLVSAARAAWPGERPLGIRIRPPREPALAVPLLRDLAARGCDVVAVAGAPAGAAGPAFVSDLIRHSLHLATICEGPQTHAAAETALVSGRADLVEVP
jgi:hypothetical protein